MITTGSLISKWFYCTQLSMDLIVIFDIAGNWFKPPIQITDRTNLVTQQVFKEPFLKTNQIEKKNNSQFNNRYVLLFC